jgi:hypothetical protein
MSIALKYTTLKDSSLALNNFKAERGRQWLRLHGKTLAIFSVFALAVLLPFFFLYALVGPEGYRQWSYPQAQANETSFVEEYAATPIPQQQQQDYLTQ